MSKQYDEILYGFHVGEHGFDKDKILAELEEYAARGENNVNTIINTAAAVNNQTRTVLAMPRIFFTSIFFVLLNQHFPVLQTR